MASVDWNVKITGGLCTSMAPTKGGGMRRTTPVLVLGIDPRNEDNPMRPVEAFWYS